MIFFEFVVNFWWFIKILIIFFFNKIDIFCEKLFVLFLLNIFFDFRGGNDYDMVCFFLFEKFVGLNNNFLKSIYVYYIDVMDIKVLKFVIFVIKWVIKFLFVDYLLIDFLVM